MLQTVIEGQETPKFWDFLGGKVPYLNCRPSTLKDLKINDHLPILYTLTPEQNYKRLVDEICVYVMTYQPNRQFGRLGARSADRSFFFSIPLTGRVPFIRRTVPVIWLAVQSAYWTASQPTVRPVSKPFRPSHLFRWLRSGTPKKFTVEDTSSTNLHT